MALILPPKRCSVLLSRASWLLRLEEVRVVREAPPTVRLRSLLAGLINRLWLAWLVSLLRLAAAGGGTGTFSVVEKKKEKFTKEITGYLSSRTQPRLTSSVYLLCVG